MPYEMNSTGEQAELCHPRTSYLAGMYLRYLMHSMTRHIRQGTPGRLILTLLEWRGAKTVFQNSFSPVLGRFVCHFMLNVQHRLQVIASL